MAISTRQVKNKRDSNGVLTGRPGTVYDVNIKYTAPDGKKKSYAKKGFATKKEAAQHEAEMKTKLQNPGSYAYFSPFSWCSNVSTEPQISG